MTDTFSTEKRSAIMKKIKGKGNLSTEVKLMQIFKKNGITGWQRNYPAIGKPDFVFLDKRIAVFADGCFWHGHSCRNIIPKQNANYWNKKRKNNIDRDRKISLLFARRGWEVLRFWECDIKRGDINLKSIQGDR